MFIKNLGTHLHPKMALKFDPNHFIAEFGALLFLGSQLRSLFHASNNLGQALNHFTWQISKQEINPNTLIMCDKLKIYRVIEELLSICTNYSPVVFTGNDLVVKCYISRLKASSSNLTNIVRC